MSASPLAQNPYYIQNSRQFYPPVPQRYGYPYQQFPQYQHPQRYYPQRYPYHYPQYSSRQQYIPEIGLEDAVNAIPIFSEVIYVDELGEI